MLAICSLYMKNKIKMLKSLIFALGVMVVLGGCAQSPHSTSEDEINSEFHLSNPDDPFESFNRMIWELNYGYLDPYVARPVSLFYVNYVPSFARTGISNFIQNLEEPSGMLNSLFMQEGDVALIHFNRFWINSTFGLGGILDVASAADIQKLNTNQFGDVMGYYELGSGPYFMLPVYGPITLREALGDMVDDLYPPLVWLTAPQALLKWFFDGMESRAALVYQEGILNNSPDPYAFTRDVYLQNKVFKAQGNKTVKEEAQSETFDASLLDEIDDY